MRDHFELLPPALTQSPEGADGTVDDSYGRGGCRGVAWVTAQGYEHVAMEIANEFAHAGYANWPEGEWLRSSEGQVELIEVAKEAAPDLLVTTSGMGSGTTFDPVANAGDFTIIHFNNTETDAIPSKVEASRAYGKPVV